MKLDKNKAEILMAQKLMTYGELAKKADLSRTSITRILLGKHDTMPITVGKIANALECNIEDILEEG